MKRFSFVFAVAVLFFVVTSSGCNSTKKDVPTPASQAQPGGTLTGKVVETMNSGGYTYVSLENGGKNFWVAVPATTVKVGQQITCQPGMVMNDFTSPSLNRKFESIIFSGGVI